MKEKLKIGIIRLNDTQILYRVLEQDESLRANEQTGLITLYNDIISIKSSHFPQIDKNSLFIRGRTRIRDDKYVDCEFDTKQECDDFLENVRKAVKDLNSKEDTIAENNLGLKVEVIV